MAKLIKKYVVKNADKQLYAIPALLFGPPYCLWDPSPKDALLYAYKWEAKDFVKRINDGKCKYQIEKIYTNE